MNGHHGEAPHLLMRNITKTFPGVVANDQVTLEVRTGKIHALLGENGAGKTTLMHILYGLYQPDVGEILLQGRPVRIRSPRDAIALGLPETRFFFPARQVERRIREVAERHGLEIDPRAAIWQLSTGEQQRVEILKALMRGARVLILDEPTGILTPGERESLFRVLQGMAAAGHAIIFITHKLDEVMAIADSITVLRKGRVVAALSKNESDRRSLARLMVGREIVGERPKRKFVSGEAVLTVSNLWARNDRRLPALRGISFSVHQREILGVAGVAGNGQRGLIEVLTGLRHPLTGHVDVCGRDMTGASARDLFRAGVAHIPEDRRRRGIVPGMSVAENLVLRRYRERPFAKGPLLDLHAVTEFAERTVAAYGIDTTGPHAAAQILSGGNLQRLILARELSSSPRLLIASHPTHGLDIGATDQIHELLLQQRDQGAALLLISEDLEEIFRLADRILVLYAGEVKGILPVADAEP